MYIVRLYLYFCGVLKFGTRLYDIKYSYLIEIICKQIIHRTIADTTTSVQSRPGSDGNEEILHTLLTSRTRTPPPDAV